VNFREEMYEKEKENIRVCVVWCGVVLNAIILKKKKNQNNAKLINIKLNRRLKR
jgi:hypothetical protein